MAYNRCEAQDYPKQLLQQILRGVDLMMMISLQQFCILWSIRQKIFFLSDVTLLGHYSCPPSPGNARSHLIASQSQTAVYRSLIKYVLHLFRMSIVKNTVLLQELLVINRLIWIWHSMVLTFRAEHSSNTAIWILRQMQPSLLEACLKFCDMSLPCILSTLCFFSLAELSLRSNDRCLLETQSHV